MKIRTLSMLALFCELLVAGASAQTSTAVVYKYAAINYPGGNAQSTTASGINNSNVIVGSYSDSSGMTHGFEYANGKYSTVDFPGATGTAALGVSDTGDVVGWYQTSIQSSNTHGFLRHNGTFTTIDYPGSFSTVAAGINKSGTIVGNYDNQDSGFVYQNGTFTPYVPPTNDGVPEYYTTLNGINNSGEFVGQVLNGDYWRGFWVAGTDVDFLQPFGSYSNTVTGVNGRGDIVGCQNYSNGYVAFTVESSEGSESTEKFPRVQPLSNPFAKSWCPNSINSARVIVGPGYTAVPVLTLNVTNPKNHSTDTNPVHVAATASGVNPISQIQVWVNSKEVYHVSGGTLNAYITLPTGSNERFVVQAVDSKGVIAKVVDSITVK
jgi:hypothetical protein